MKRNNRVRTILIIALIVAALWSLWPTIRVATMSAQEREQMAAVAPERWRNLQNKAINLGLDLSGGMHLVIEIDLEAIPEGGRSDAQQRFVEIIRNRVDQYGVSEPVIQTQGRNRVIVELAGVQDPDQARDLVGRTAVLSYQFLKQGEVVAELVQRINRTLYSGLVSGEIAPERIGYHLLGDRVRDLLGPAGLQPGRPDTLQVPDQPLSLYLFQDPRSPEVLYAEENMTAWVDSILTLPRIRALTPSDAEWHWGMWPDRRFAAEGLQYRELFLTEASRIVEGEHLEDATVSIGGPQDVEAAGQPIVNFRLTPEGGRIIGRVTEANLNRRMAIVLDNRVAVAPRVLERLGPTSRITGIGQMQEAQNIAIVLRSGALPAPATIVENRTVTASLGLDSIRAGTSAAIFGLAMVILFMTVYYKRAGLIADTALLLNLVFILAVLAGFGFTLTLPGIAGIILTMGMAVDANVLIFERIREELRAGKTIRASVEAGYANATSAILDANITTLITGLVLYQFGTGPIRGFALTLCIGIISSVFTALIVTRLIYDTILAKRAPKKLSI